MSAKYYLTRGILSTTAQDDDSQEELILKLLQPGRPLSAETISFILGADRFTVNRRLRRLLAYGEIQLVTEKRVRIWGLNRKKNHTEVAP